MIDPDLLRRLEKIVGPEYVSSSRAAAEVYSYDGSQATGTPQAVVLPADTRQTADVVRAATEAGVPYIPRGFGTNLSGGSVAPTGGVVIGLARLGKILEIRPEGRYAVLQPGVTNLELQEALAPSGYFFAPDPASQKIATLGGNIGENAGGPHCVKYGVTSNHILSMTVVLPGGDVVRTGGAALDPPGYDLRGVLVGSEGTLGIVTELVVRILPMPESLVTLLIVYDDVADAARSVSAVVAAGIIPATLEMMDATVIRAVEESRPCGYPLDAGAVLIAEVDGPVAGLNQQAERLGQLCIDNGAREVRRAKDAAERDRLWAGRRGAFGALARLAPNFLVADCTVPRNRLPDALTRVAEVAEKYQLEHANVFHAGDGNLHPVLFFDSRQPELVRRVHEAGGKIMEACVALGGTITGEHGVGVEKRNAMRMVFSEDDLDIQRRLREAFDPDDLINPGKIIPPPAEESNGHDAPTVEEIEGRGELVPADVDQACGMVHGAAEKGVALAPTGNGTRPEFGNCSPSPLIPLRSTGISAVIDYDPDNQVVAVGSGMTLQSLQDVLAERSQWLPLRPPQGGDTTLGAVAALGDCGPERLRYGAPRDLLLGLKFVSGAGRLISVGGRVVKNVAGYDLTRLLTGSAGTLGFITELTFRISSTPLCCVAFEASGSFDQCRAAAAKLLGSRLEPIFVVGVPADATLRLDTGANWRLIGGFEGFRETVTAQFDGCRTLLTAAGVSVGEPREYPPRDGICGEFFDVLSDSPYVLRIDVPPDRAAAMASAAQDALPQAVAVIDFGCGRITTGFSTLEDGPWSQLCKSAEEAGGHLTLQAAPEEFRRRHDVFAPPTAGWQLLHRIKAALDPKNVFAPGRLPGRK